MIRALLFVCTCLALSACGTTLKDRPDDRPLLRIEEYFLGHSTAHGVVLGRDGEVLRRMEVDLHGRWESGEFVLEEDFRYSDGRTERRVWRIRVLPDGRYEGRADDVVGVAEGRVSGSTLTWRYVLRLVVDDTTWDLNFDDTMWLIDGQVLLNRARFSKFGLHLGEVLISFRRVPEAASGEVVE